MFSHGKGHLNGFTHSPHITCYSESKDFIELFVASDFFLGMKMVQDICNMI